MQTLNWRTGSNGNLFADAAGFRYSIGRDPRGAGYWVARDGHEIASGLIDLAYAKQVAQQDAADRS